MGDIDDTPILLMLKNLFLLAWRCGIDIDTFTQRGQIHRYALLGGVFWTDK